MTHTCAQLSCSLTHFVSDVDLAEAEGAEVGVGRLHGRLDHLVEELLHKLTDVGPHLFDCLRGREGTEKSNQRINVGNTVVYTASSPF